MRTAIKTFTLFSKIHRIKSRGEKVAYSEREFGLIKRLRFQKIVGQK